MVQFVKIGTATDFTEQKSDSRNLKKSLKQSRKKFGHQECILMRIKIGLNGFVICGTEIFGERRQIIESVTRKNFYRMAAIENIFIW